MRNSEVLFKASQVIEERGWTRGTEGWSGGSPTGEVCLEGAIEMVTGQQLRGVYNHCPAARALREFMAERDMLEAGVQGWPFLWNDRPERTKAEVIEVLRAAAISELVKEKNAELDALAAAREVVDAVVVPELESVA